VGAYLDNSATTKVCDAAVQAAVTAMTADYGNPSSLHTLGIQANKTVTEARRAVAAMLGLNAAGSDLSRIVFTSGGTEANNLALFGAAAARRRDGNHIVTTAVEHPSVLEAMRRLEQDGFELTVVSPDSNGDFDAATLAEACRPDTVLVAIMAVNNELGTQLPLKEAIPMIRRKAPGAHIHCDAVQAIGKLPIRVRTLDADTVSLSGHKLHAPKGVGALYIKQGIRLVPRTWGGGQEQAIRSGTEAVPAIAALGAAVRQLPPPPAFLAHCQQLMDRLIDGLRTIEPVVIHRPQQAVPYILSISVPGFKSETLVHFLADRGVYVSAGSACAKGHDSHVLKAIGLTPDHIHSALRISLCADNTPDDIDIFLTALKEAIASVAHVR